MATVLIVDDEKEICILLRDAFSLHGHEVEMASTGEEALEKLKSRYYDVLILDLVMPGIGGVGVLERREEYPYTAVVVLTAFGSKDTAVLALRHNADDYLDKPIAPSKVVHLVESLVRRFEVDAIIVDTEVKTAYFQEEPIELPPELFNLFVPFIRHATKSFTYRDLAFIVTNEKMDDARAMEFLRAQMHRLRKRLRERTGREVIRSGQYGPGKLAEFSYFHARPRNS